MLDYFKTTWPFICVPATRPDLFDLSWKLNFGSFDLVYRGKHVFGHVVPDYDAKGIRWCALKAIDAVELLRRDTRQEAEFALLEWVMTTVNLSRYDH